MIYLVTGNQSLFDNESTDYTVISIEQSLSLLESLSIIGVDTETEGIDVHTKKLLLAQFGCFDFQIVVDCRTIDITHYKDLLERKDKLFLFWNAKFDLKFFLKHGIIVKNIYDGYLAEKLQWNGYPAGIHSMSLKSAGEKYCNIELDKSVRGKIIWSKTLTTDIIVYGAQDVQYLEKIREKQLELLKAKDLVTALAYENKFCPVLAYFEFCGVKLDEDKWKAKMKRDQDKFNKALNDLNQWVVNYYKDNNGVNCTWIETTFIFKTEEYGQIEEYTPKGEWKLISPIEKIWEEGTSNMAFHGYKWVAKIRQKFPFVYINPQGDLWEGFDLEPRCTINWSSPKQVAPFLELLGFNLETYDKKTKERKKSVSADVIKSQLEVSTIAPIYIEYKEWEKVVGTYGQNVLDQINPKTGRIHTNFSQCGTDTLRLSSGGKDKENNVEYLNFQNFPANAETRECFIAEPGNKWISADYSGQESRILADLAHDEAMLELFKDPKGDIHSLVAKMSYPDIIGDCPVSEIKEKFKKWRQAAKGVEFAVNYGGNAQTIKSNSNIPLEEAEEIYNNYMNGFKGVKQYQDIQRAFVMKNGYIILNSKTRAKAFIYDFDELKEIEKRFNSEYWSTYKLYKQSNPDSAIVADVKHYFRRKSASEKQAINYKCQGTGAAIFKLACIFFFDYLLEHDLVFKVKLCAPVHDEINIEVPEESAEELAEVLTSCMNKAGRFFCPSLDFPCSAEISDHWVH